MWFLWYYGIYLIYYNIFAWIPIVASILNAFLLSTCIIKKKKEFPQVVLKLWILRIHVGVFCTMTCDYFFGGAASLLLSDVVCFPALVHNA